MGTGMGTGTGRHTAGRSRGHSHQVLSRPGGSTASYTATGHLRGRTPELPRAGQHQQVEAGLLLGPLLWLPFPCPQPPRSHLPAYSPQTPPGTGINDGLFQVFSPLSPKEIFILNSIFHFFSITTVPDHLPTTLLFSHKHKSYYLFSFCVFAL